MENLKKVLTFTYVIWAGETGQKRQIRVEKQRNRIYWVSFQQGFIMQTLAYTFNLCNIKSLFCFVIKMQ